MLVLKLSVGDVSRERLADLLNNSDLVRAVKAENLRSEIRRTHWAPLDLRRLHVSFRASLPKGHGTMFFTATGKYRCDNLSVAGLRLQCVAVAKDT